MPDNQGTESTSQSPKSTKSEYRWKALCAIIALASVGAILWKGVYWWKIAEKALALWESLSGTTWQSTIAITCIASLVWVFVRSPKDSPLKTSLFKWLQGVAGLLIIWISMLGVYALFVAPAQVYEDLTKHLPTTETSISIEDAGGGGSGVTGYSLFIQAIASNKGPDTSIRIDKIEIQTEDEEVLRGKFFRLAESSSQQMLGSDMKIFFLRDGNLLDSLAEPIHKGVPRPGFLFATFPRIKNEQDLLASIVKGAIVLYWSDGFGKRGVSIAKAEKWNRVPFPNQVPVMPGIKHSIAVPTNQSTNANETK